MIRCPDHKLWGTATSAHKIAAVRAAIEAKDEREAKRVVAIWNASWLLYRQLLR